MITYIRKVRVTVYNISKYRFPIPIFKRTIKKRQIATIKKYYVIDNKITKKSRYYVKDIVCDYQIIDRCKREKINHIFYSNRIATEVCKLLNEDYKLSKQLEV